MPENGIRAYAFSADRDLVMIEVATIKTRVGMSSKG
jgi:hypothetical protein